jgi:hypothetical protein
MRVKLIESSLQFFPGSGEGSGGYSKVEAMVRDGSGE